MHVKTQKEKYLRNMRKTSTKYHFNCDPPLVLRCDLTILCTAQWAQCHRRSDLPLIIFVVTLTSHPHEVSWLMTNYMFYVLRDKKLYVW